jgi:RNA polymerase primary sigma factor
MLDVIGETDPRCAEIFAMRRGLQNGKVMSYDEIGKLYGLTRERIRQIELQALSRLKHPSNSLHLREFYEAQALVD